MFARFMLLVFAAAATVAAGPIPVRTQTVTLTEARSLLILSGTVQARVQAELAFRVGGKIIARPIEIGDHVGAGQELARIDKADLQASQEAARAALVAAQADAANAEADLRRYEALGRASPAYLPSEYDKRLAAMRSTAARVLQAQRQVDLARNQSDYGVLHADADGVVTALPVQTGQVVAAGQTVATVALTGEKEILVDVPENRMSDLTQGAPATVGLWAYPDLRLRGRIREIGTLANPATRTFMVKVTLLDTLPDTAAFGMTAIVSFGRGETPVAILPASALTDVEGKPAVFLLDANGTTRLQPVTVGFFDGDGSVAVTDGLQPGDRVITAGLHHLSPGMAATAWVGAAR